MLSPNVVSLNGSRPTTRVHVIRLAAVGAVATALVAGPGVPEPAKAESFGHRRAVTASTSRSATPVAKPAAPATVPASSASAGRMARALYGTPRSGLAWHSGIWTGSGMSASRTAQAERWAGRPFDFVTVYPGYNTWAEMSDSAWTSQLMKGYQGKLAYGLPLLPNNRRGHWEDVLSGQNDAVFRKIARDLRQGGFGDAAVRVGLEGNGDWFAWGATYATAPKFRAAFQRVVKIMNAETPSLTFWFDTSSGFGLTGQRNRMDALTQLYPGDAYVDGISMDHYDFWELTAKTTLSWSKALRPAKGPGLADAAEFARAHHKAFAVPEWGVHGASFGGGDNAFFVQKMYDFFRANRDVLAFECYFNEPDAYIKNSIFSPVQMPKASAAYLRLF